MHSIIGRRLGRLALAAVTIFAVAGGIAFASIPDSAGVIHGCYRTAAADQGQLRVVDDPASCRSNETAIQWNERGAAGPAGPAGADGSDGTDGADGSSPTVAQLAPGDANCAGGGAAITDAAGTTAYVCNGTQGPAGQDGAPFSGTFTSPNGQYSINVTDAGVTVASPDSAIRVTDSAIRVESMGLDLIELKGANVVRVESGAGLQLKAGATASLEAGAGLTLRGSFVSVNGPGCAAAARVGDLVTVAGSLGSIVTGSPTVCIG